MSTPIVYLAGVAWDAVRGTDRHLVERLARTRHVVWVDPPVSVTHIVRAREIERLRSPASVSSPVPGVTRVSVLVPPWPLRAGVVRLTERVVRHALADVLDQRGVGTVAVVNASPYLSFDVVDRARTSTRLYYATDDFVAAAELWGVRAASIAAAEGRRLREADAVAAVSPRILRRWEAASQGGGRPQLVLPNGCDSGAYAAAGDRPADVPDAGLPVVGLVGQVSARLDLALLEAVADRPVTLLVVGPVLPDVDQDRMRALADRPNVACTGPRPFDALPGYLATMDVGVTPYLDTDFNRASFPLKTLEYLAAGLPVVSTPLPAVADLGTDLIVTADDPGAFADAVERLARAEADEETAQRRRRFAAEHDWTERAARLLALLEPAEGRPADRRHPENRQRREISWHH